MRIFILSLLCLSLSLANSASVFAKDFESYFHSKPLPTPEILFQDKEKRTYSLSKFKGKVLLVNIWATWCKPCVEEMPSLDRLQKSSQKDGIYVFPISLDQKPVEEIAAFFTRYKIKNLPVLKDYHRSFGNLSVQGLPTTIIINRKGEEVGRVTGAIEWDDPFILEYLKKL